MNIDGKIAQANGRLKSAGIRLRVEQSGLTLTLRGTLPPKPDSQQVSPHQQRIAIGQPASIEGLKQAEAQARIISGLITSNQFDWADFTRIKRESKESQDQRTVQEWIELLQEDYLQKGGKFASWRDTYATMLKRLPQNEKPTANMLEKLVLTTEPNSRSRKRACTAVKAIAAIAGIDYSPTGLYGKYNLNSVAARDLVADSVIVEWFNKIPLPGWRWIYAMMAVYGLRPHECFRVNYDSLKEGNNICEVLPNTKTGSRLVWPYYPEWFTDFEIATVQLPKVNPDRDNKAVGNAVTCYFREKLKLPFTPYTLRHCWAVRTIAFNLPSADAARQMGHSVRIHERTYQRWITPQQQQETYNLLLQNPCRPKPPK